MQVVHNPKKEEAGSKVKISKTCQVVSTPEKSNFISSSNEMKVTHCEMVDSSQASGPSPMTKLFKGEVHPSMTGEGVSVTFTNIEQLEKQRIDAFMKEPELAKDVTTAPDQEVAQSPEEPEIDQQKTKPDRKSKRKSSRKSTKAVEPAAEEEEVLVLEDDEQEKEKEQEKEEEEKPAKPARRKASRATRAKPSQSVCQSVSSASEPPKYECEFACGFEHCIRGTVEQHEQECKLNPALALQNADDDEEEIVKTYGCEHDCGFEHEDRSLVEDHEKTCAMNPAVALKENSESPARDLKNDKKNATRSRGRRFAQQASMAQNRSATVVLSPKVRAAMESVSEGASTLPARRSTRAK